MKVETTIHFGKQRNKMQAEKSKSLSGKRTNAISHI